jgi:hypothetical protein
MNESGRYFKALFGELRRLGYVEEQNLIVERYSGEGKIAHYAELASEVVRQQPDVVFTSGNPMIRYFKEATTTIPIVGLLGDPVAFGLVSTLARPGANITGVSVDAGPEIWSKRLGLLRELIPAASKVGYLVSRDYAESPMAVAMREAAQRAKISLIAPPLEGTIQEAEYRRVFKLMTQERAVALIVGVEVVTPLPSQPARKPQQPILSAKEHAARFAVECFQAGGEMELAAIPSRYATWCPAPDQLPQAQIGQALAKLFHDAGITRAERDGRSVVVGLSLKPESEIVHLQAERKRERARKLILPGSWRFHRAIQIDPAIP